MDADKLTRLERIDAEIAAQESRIDRLIAEARKAEEEEGAGWEYRESIRDEKAYLSGLHDGRNHFINRHVWGDSE
jgi:hypothetical protein